MLKKKVRFLSREELERHRRGEVGFPAAVEGFFKEISAELPLYISIDKDILCKKDASTTWSQGDMSLEELKSCLEAVFLHLQQRGGKIAGVDICGEQSQEEGAPGSVNDRANRELLDVIRRGAVFEE